MVYIQDDHSKLADSDLLNRLQTQERILPIQSDPEIAAEIEMRITELTEEFDRRGIKLAKPEGSPVSQLA